MKSPSRLSSLILLISCFILAVIITLINFELSEPFWTTFEKYPSYYLRIVSDFCLVATMSLVLGVVYIKVGNPLNNRVILAASFVPLSLTTFLLVAIIQNSLALSLGMVGALSIVRFRAAIKDPEELVFLFINISVGIGVGAQKQGLTVLVFLGLMLITVLLRYFKYFGPKSKTQSMFIRLPTPEAISFEKLQADLSSLTPVKIKKYEESPSGIQIFLEFNGSNHVNNQLISFFRDRYQNPTISLSDVDQGTF